MFKHVPKHSRHSSHDSDTGDLGTPTQLDSSIPDFHLGVVLEEMKHKLSQHESRNLAAFLGDRTKSILIVSRVSTTGRETKVVRQTARARKAFDGTNSAG